MPPRHTHQDSAPIEAAGTDFDFAEDTPASTDTDAVEETRPEASSGEFWQSVSKSAWGLIETATKNVATEPASPRSTEDHEPLLTPDTARAENKVYEAAAQATNAIQSAGTMLYRAITNTVAAIPEQISAHSPSVENEILMQHRQAASGLIGAAPAALTVTSLTAAASIVEARAIAKDESDLGPLDAPGTAKVELERPPLDASASHPRRKTDAPSDSAPYTIAKVDSDESVSHGIAKGPGAKTGNYSCDPLSKAEGELDSARGAAKHSPPVDQSQAGIAKGTHDTEPEVAGKEGSALSSVHAIVKGGGEQQVQPGILKDQSANQITNQIERATREVIVATSDLINQRSAVAPADDAVKPPSSKQQSAANEPLSGPAVSRAESNSPRVPGDMNYPSAEMRRSPDKNDTNNGPVLEVKQTAPAEGSRPAGGTPMPTEPPAAPRHGAEQNTVSNPLPATPLEINKSRTTETAAGSSPAHTANDGRTITTSSLSVSGARSGAAPATETGAIPPGFNDSGRVKLDAGSPGTVPSTKSTIEPSYVANKETPLTNLLAQQQSDLAIAGRTPAEPCAHPVATTAEQHATAEPTAGAVLVTKTLSDHPDAPAVPERPPILGLLQTDGRRIEAATDSPPQTVPPHTGQNVSLTMRTTQDFGVLQRGSIVSAPGGGIISGGAHFSSSPNSTLAESRLIDLRTDLTGTPGFQTRVSRVEGLIPGSSGVRHEVLLEFLQPATTTRQSDGVRAATSQGVLRGDVNREIGEVKSGRIQESIRASEGRTIDQGRVDSAVRTFDASGRQGIRTPIYHGAIENRIGEAPAQIAKTDFRLSGNGKRYLITEIGLAFVLAAGGIRRVLPSDKVPPPSRGNSNDKAGPQKTPPSEKKQPVAAAELSSKFSMPGKALFRTALLPQTVVERTNFPERKDDTSFLKAMAAEARKALQAVPLPAQQYRMAADGLNGNFVELDDPFLHEANAPGELERSGRRKSYERSVAGFSGGADDDANNRIALPAVLTRPTWLIAPGETLVSIAENQYNDPNIAWLIADLNRAQSDEHWIDGKCIIEFNSRQQLTLPVWQDVEEFYASNKAPEDPDRLITIVKTTKLDRDVVENALSKIMGTTLPAPASGLTSGINDTAGSTEELTFGTK